MNPLIDVALQVFPEIVRYLGRDGKDGMAERVAAAVQQVAKTSDPQKAHDAVAADPRTASELRMRLGAIAAAAEADWRQSEMEKLKASLLGQMAAAPGPGDAPAVQAGEQDRAREFATMLTRAAGPMIWGSLGVSFIVAVSFIVLLGLILWNPERFAQLQDNQVAFQLINITIGALTAAFATVVSFWLGSSQGSRDKDEAAYRLQVQQAEHAHDMAKTQSARIERLAHQASGAAAPAPAVAPGDDAPSARVRFNACVDVTLQQEGGYVDDPRDPGGATNMGITLKTLQEWRGTDVTTQDVENLTVAEAKQIYYAKYWNAMRCGALQPGVDLEVFDFGVNAGIGRAAKTLQECVGAAADGVIGPVTIDAARKFTPTDIVERYSQKRMDFYRSLRDFPTFGRDWTNRVRSVETVALRMAERA